MTMTAKIAIVTALLIGTHAAHSAPAYCVTASAKLFGDDKSGVAALQSCQPGDIIQFPSGATYVAAVACDFSKAVISTGRTIVCVYSGGTRSQR